jgi:PKD repeat protein
LQKAGLFRIVVYQFDRMKKALLLILFSFTFGVVFSQDWAAQMEDPTVNFYEVQKNFNAYWSTRNSNEPGNGYKAFRRWEAFMTPRVYPTGDKTLVGQTWSNYREYQQREAAHKTIGNQQPQASTWTALGPLGAMSGVADNGFPRKAGRDNFITFHPGDTATFWVGAPAGGLWKTTNSGASWNTNTDALPVIGCSDLAIDASNTQIMYLATGDGDGGDTPSIGVLKSTDGGLTWNTTGLNWSASLGRRIRRLIIHPTNPQILFAASSVGIWKTSNGGTSWTQLNTGTNFYDIEFKPGNPNTLYACGTSFYRSTNGGASFSASGITGLPSSASLSRMAIAVTAADTGYVYVLAAKSASSSYAFQGVYRATNSGTAFTTMSTTPDILSNPCSGSGGSAQGWYDLAFGANPVNKDDISVGGINVWRSLNGGAAWTSIGCWIGTGSPPYVHADHHCLSYNAYGKLYSANDGGIFVYTGSSWTDITSTRNIAQIYKIGISGLTADLFITGHQDNGSNIYNAGVYSASRAGDGMDCFIDRTNDSRMFSAQPNGAYKKSTNGGASWSTCTSGLSGTAGWVAPWKQDPVTATTLYAGYSQMFKSTNTATSWSQLGTLGGSGTIVEFAVAPSNTQVIYVIKGTDIFKTTDGGNTWNLINGTIPTSSAAPTFITISPTDENTAWVTLSGYSAANKVFKTIDGGANWVNITSNLPNIPANCSVYQPGSANDAIYIGMDVGVYYTDNTLSAWVNYSAGLPNVPVSDMEIFAATQKLYASTYGRGVYAVDAYAAPTSVPVSAFTVATANPCEGVAVNFTDQSTNLPSAWAWSFQSGTPATSTAQNPSVTFATAGTYTVSLTATNSAGTGSTVTQTVTILPSPSISVTPASAASCAGTAVTFTASGATTYTWSGPGGTNAVATYSPNSSATFTVTGSNGTCTGKATVSLSVTPNPVITVSSPSQTVCAGSPVTYTVVGASTYTWTGGATGSVVTYTPGANTVYTVTGTSNGCSSSKTATVTVKSVPAVTITPFAGSVCDNAGVQTLSGTPAGGTFSGPGVSGNTFDPSIGAGTYVLYYTYTDVNNCTGTDSAAVTVQGCIGIAKYASSEVFVYPNPASGECLVKMSGAASMTAELIDVLGHTLQKRNAEVQGGNSLVRFSLAGLSEGVYFVRIRHNGKTQVVKLIHN